MKTFKAIVVFTVWLLSLLMLVFWLDGHGEINSIYHIGFWSVMALGNTFLLYIECKNDNDQKA